MTTKAPEPVPFERPEGLPTSPSPPKKAKILVREVPPELHQRLLKAGGRRPGQVGKARNGTSMNAIVLDLLERGIADLEREQRERDSAHAE